MVKDWNMSKQINFNQLDSLDPSERILRLKQNLFEKPRYFSIEQAKLITESYKQNPNLTRILQRARAFAHTAENISVKIDPEELIVGNRTPDSRAGVVSPEAAVVWIDKELDSLPNRPQDPFEVREKGKKDFRETILSFWKGKTLEDEVKKRLGSLLDELDRTVKINQKDHAQGHIIPDVKIWLKLGPAGLIEQCQQQISEAVPEKKEFYQSVIIVLEASRELMRRYGQLADKMIEDQTNQMQKENLSQIRDICFFIVDDPPVTFRQAVQSLWFCFVLLQLESNASSFSPGRMDQYLYPYLKNDLENARLTIDQALEILESLWLKFNQIVYMRNSSSAKYFAGFPIGFNICIGGQTRTGEDATNLLSFLCLKAQEHLLLPQPNLSVRLHENSPDEFLDEVTKVIGLGSGMPQLFNDESIIPALISQGVEKDDAMDYGVVGCVELSTQGNMLGWSDAAMFNMVKVLELTLNNGRCMLTDKQIGPQTGYLTDFESFEEFETAFNKQIDFFLVKMIRACSIVDQTHADIVPSPFLSSLISNCIENGIDVTAGGAKYNLSGIQAIQPANVADSIAVIKKLVFEERTLSAEKLIDALKNNFQNNKVLRYRLLNEVPKYGNDIEWVDQLGAKWVEKFAKKLKTYKNVRGGNYHTGLYTVSAHVPMGQNVAATPDGRFSRQPLADGGLSAMSGRDQKGPTALLKSVSRINAMYGSNGTLLNMKFLPSFFRTKHDRDRFAAMLKAFVRMHINHVQFNVINKEDLIKAKENPENYGHLTVRVAGYTAYFTELAADLQDEIIARTAFGA